MSIEILTDLYPTKESMYGGIFVYERLKEFCKQNIDFETWIVHPRKSKLTKIIMSCFNKEFSDDVVAWDFPRKQHVIYDNKSIINTFISHYIPQINVRKRVKILEKNIDFKDRNISILRGIFILSSGAVAVELSKKYHIPCVISAHGSDINFNLQSSGFRRKYTLKTLNNANKVIFVSNDLLNSAKKYGYHGNNAVVIRNGINTDKYLHINKEEVMNKTGIMKINQHIVGFVGNLIERKRAEILPVVFKEIANRIHNVEFIIIGDGHLKEYIEQQCLALGLCVHFTGRINHDLVPYWMNLFDVMLLPSISEGLPNVIVEAYACGVPVIGSDGIGIPEAINGLCPIVPAGDEFERRFAIAACDVISKKIPIDSSNLIQEVKKYTWENCVKAELEIFNELCHECGEKIK